MVFAVVFNVFVSMNDVYVLYLLQGYTIPLDKRLAADGRGLQTVHINENFAKLAEALYIADRKVTSHFIAFSRTQNVLNLHVVL